MMSCNQWSSFIEKEWLHIYMCQQYYSHMQTARDQASLVILCALSLEPWCLHNWLVVDGYKRALFSEYSMSYFFLKRSSHV